MSSNPFGDQNPNPYQPSSFTQPGFGGGGDEYARSKVKVVAIILMVMAAITILIRLISFAVPAINLGQMGGGGANPNEAAEMVGGVVGNIIGLLVNIAVLFGAYQMMNLKTYPAAMTAAVISCIPCCSPCVILGIPFGIWAIVVLVDPQVKAAFR